VIVSHRRSQQQKRSPDVRFISAEPNILIVRAASAADMTISFAPASSEVLVVDADLKLKQPIP
jgi:hypothetical protein